MLKIIVRLGDPTIMDRVAGSSLLEQAREYDDVDAEDVAGYTACKHRLVHQTLDYELTTYIPRSRVHAPPSAGKMLLAFELRHSSQQLRVSGTEGVMGLHSSSATGISNSTTKLRPRVEITLNKSQLELLAFILQLQTQTVLSLQSLLDQVCCHCAAKSKASHLTPGTLPCALLYCTGLSCHARQGCGSR